MRNLIQRFNRDSAGATAIEYSLIAAFIAMAIIVALQAVGVELFDIFGSVEAGLKKRATV